MDDPDFEATPSDDEVGIFIDSRNNYRVLLPRAWVESDGPVPEFAYLVVAALIRLSRKSEIEFHRDLARWAAEDLKKTGELSVAHLRKPETPN